MKSTNPITVEAKDHHRNGVTGEPFNVYIFNDPENGRMVGIDFGGARFAVLNIEQLAKGDIAFMSNSWKGECYAPFVRKENQ
jgi:hypothetical protein